MRTGYAQELLEGKFERLGRQYARAFLVFVTFLCFLLVSDGYAQNQYASKQRQNVAIGHYARTRAMLVEALAEFEQGRKVARPDLLIDSEEFRLRLISLAEELNRVIDPKPRVSRDGVVFRANPRMIKREQDRLPTVPDGAQDSNEYGENRRLKEMQASRRKMYEEAAATEKRIGIKRDAESGQEERALKPEAEEFDEDDEELIEQEDQKVKEAVAAELEKAVRQQQIDAQAEDDEKVIVIDTAKERLPKASQNVAPTEEEEEEAGVAQVDVNKKVSVESKVDSASPKPEKTKIVKAEPLPAETAAKIQQELDDSEGQTQSEVDKTSAAIERSVEERLRMLGEKGKVESQEPDSVGEE